MKFPIDSHYIVICTILFLASVSCLYEDQAGKLDWRKQFIGIPQFVHYQPASKNFIVGTRSNVISSIQSGDGAIIWRQVLPKGCNLSHMSILRAENEDSLIQTQCRGLDTNQTSYWNPRTGLLTEEATYKSLLEDDQAESLMIDQGHLIGNTKAFTLSDYSSLTIAQNGRVDLRVRGDIVWSREESLASVTAVEIVTLPREMRDSFGLRKRIVLVTEIGTVYGIDTLTGQIVWDFFDENISATQHKSEATLIITKQSDESAEESRALVINSAGYVIYINPITGQVLETKRLGNSIQQIAKTELDASDGERSIIILDSKNKVHVFPEESKSRVVENIDKYYLTIVKQTPDSMQGYRFTVAADEIESKQIWNFPISDSETIVNLNIKRTDERVHSPARVLGDRGILYKYLNPNLIALLTQGTTGDACSPDFFINVYLVDGVTGALVHSVHHPKSRGPSNMVHSENWLVYSYYNTKTRRTEVSSLEMFEGTRQDNSTSFSSKTRASIKPKLIEHKSFIFPSGIEAMVDTVTLRGMTNRHIIVALPTGALLEIPRIFLDPRRPINMLMEHREEGLVPYMPELPIPSESMINYNQSLLAVRKIVTSPAMLESTSLVFSYGLDLFFTRVTPSKTFDILKDDFDHLLITIVLIFLVVASYITKLLAQRKALYAAWK